MCFLPARLVPNCDKNKGAILQRAIEYILQLQEEKKNIDVVASGDLAFELGVRAADLGDSMISSQTVLLKLLISS
jgi:hypothetical protein